MLQIRKKSSYNLQRSRDSRVQILLFCPRHPFISLLRVQNISYEGNRTALETQSHSDDQ